jgi:nicotinamide mononucleotide adenylyltransferase
MNSLIEVNKPKVTQSIIIYGGRFQPFHKGHYAAYQNLVSEF